MSGLFSLASELGFASLYRIVAPGAVWALLLLPIVNPIVPRVLRIDEPIDLASILLPEILILGILVSLLSSTIYCIYEGRILWPGWLHGKLTKRMQQRVKKRLAEGDRLDRSSLEYKELWYWLRMFPLDDKGKPTARRPTILGNVLEGYEEYPLRRYGMDSVFYWYRLVPELPESFGKQLDQLWSEADCLMHSSFVGMVMGLVYAVFAIAEAILGSTVGSWIAVTAGARATLDLIPEWGSSLGWALLCLIGGYTVYRVSLPLHRRNGEYFKAAFDVYRGNIVGMTKTSPTEKKGWRDAWAYLQYMLVWCPRCERYYYAEEKRCPYCKGEERPEDEPHELAREDAAS
jgi:hypothetical protein